MTKRIALIGIVVHEISEIGKVNDLLHQFGSIIVGRMGIPYRENKISIISIVVDGDLNQINTLCGKLGMVQGISVKVMYTE